MKLHQSKGSFFPFQQKKSRGTMVPASDENSQNIKQECYAKRSSSIPAD
jgi:hypothetical protein